MPMVFKASEALCLWRDLLIKGVQCKWNNLVKERNFFYYLGRIKQNNKKQMLSKVGGGGGCNPLNPFPGSTYVMVVFWCIQYHLYPRTEKLVGTYDRQWKELKPVRKARLGGSKNKFLANTVTSTLKMIDC